MSSIKSSPDPKNKYISLSTSKANDMSIKIVRWSKKSCYHRIELFFIISLFILAVNPSVAIAWQSC